MGFFGANAFGALVADPEAAAYPAILDRIESGQVRALVLVESDPLCMCPDKSRWEKAIERLELCVVIDYLPSQTVQKADIFIPATTLFETGGLFINHQGRLQLARRNMAGGEPVLHTGKGDHPPRTFRHHAPGTDLQPPWEIIGQLGTSALDTAQGIGEDARKLKWLSQAGAHFLNLSGITTLAPDGMVLLPDQAPGLPFQPVSDQAAAAEPNTLNLILSENTFATEELSGYSPSLQAVASSPALLMSVETGQAAGLQTGDAADIKLATGTITAKVILTENMPDDVIILPRHRDIDWQMLSESAMTITGNQLKKATEAS